MYNLYVFLIVVFNIFCLIFYVDLGIGLYVIQRIDKCEYFCINWLLCCDKMVICCCGIYMGNFECFCWKGYYGIGFYGECFCKF